MDAAVCVCPHLGKSSILSRRTLRAFHDPQSWVCENCGTTESIWSCLHCAHFACGRETAKHAEQHFKSTGHGLVLEINTKYVYCYLCEDYVINDTPNKDIMRLREMLCGIEEHRIAVSTSSSAAASAKPSDRNMVKTEEAHQRDLVATILSHWKTTLLRKVFLAWRNEAAENQHAAKNMPPPLPVVMAPIDPDGRVPKPRSRAALLPGMAGLRNLGQTCFMNAILQALGHVSIVRLPFSELRNRQMPQECAAPVFADPPSYFRQSTIEVHSSIETPPIDMIRSAKRKALLATCSIRENDTQAVELLDSTLRGQDMVLCDELDKLFRVMWSGQWAVVTPYNLLIAVWNIMPDFRGFKQQDAQELMMRLTERLYDELVKRWGRPEALPPSTPWSARILMQLMGGMTRQYVQCSSCGFRSTREDPFSDLSLELSPDTPSPVTLEHLLESFVADEILDGIYLCEKCSGSRKTLRSAVKRTRISRITSLLRCHINRWSPNRRDKLRTHVTFPPQLDIRPYCSEDAATVAFRAVGMPLPNPAEAYTYDLAGVVVHEGKQLESGHYTAFCYNRANDCWIHCNDTRVAVTSMDVVFKAQAYILFYVHRGAAQYVDDQLLAQCSVPAKRTKIDFIH